MLQKRVKMKRSRQHKIERQRERIRLGQSEKGRVWERVKKREKREKEGRETGM